MKKNVLLLLICTGLPLLFYGQEEDRDKKKEQDSTEIYKKIEDYSKKTRLTKTLHKWVFRPTGKERYSKPEALPSPDYEPFSGNTISEIEIHTKDPFGFSFSDSTRVPRNWLERTGNFIHIKSKDPAIRNFLLIKEGDALDPLLVSESARLLRAQDYIREVVIIPESHQAADSVKLSITALDSWSLIPKLTLSGTRTKINIRERNFMGIGHQLKLGFAKRITDGNSGFEAEYKVPNFKNTFITGTGRYKIDYDSYFEKTIAVNREFYSSLTRWAGGLFLQERYLGRMLPEDDTMDFEEIGLKFIYQDYWAGRAFRLFRGNSLRERTTNLFSAIRMYSVHYKDKPEPDYDPIRFFSDEYFFLGSIGVSSRQYLEDRFIFRDGDTEDVPVGILYSVTGGLQRKNKTTRPYLGLRAAYGNYLKWGFLSVNFELGSYFRSSKSEQITYSFGANYFSRLLDLGGKWKMRQFVKPQVVIGKKRLNSVADRLSLNEEPYFSEVNGWPYLDTSNGLIKGFDSPAMGTEKYVLALQTQFYSPWSFLGFRFNPYFNMNLGFLADKEKSFGSNRLYTSFGVGCIIRNDYLVFDSFQISFAYLPSVPGQGHHIFLTNQFETADFGFDEFQAGKPRPVIYE